MSSSLVSTAPNAAIPIPSSASRLANLIVDPVSAFRGIAQASPWALAFLAAISVRFGSLFVFYQPAITPLKLVGGLAFQVTSVLPQLLVASALVWVVAKMRRLDVGWSATFSIVTHTYVAYTIATIAVASFAGAVLPDSTDIDLRSPPFTNLASLVAGRGDLTQRIFAELDIRSVYAIVLLWLGLRAAAPGAPRSAIARVIATVAAIRLGGVVVVQAMR